MSIGIVPLLPGCTILRMEENDHQIEVYATRTTREARCPMCGTACQRVHSRYQRQPADLPACGKAVVLYLEVRRFFCDNSDCAKRIFCEPIQGWLLRYARQTCRLKQMALQVVKQLGGEAGSKLATQLGFAFSPDTLLRWLNQNPLPPIPAPRIVGIDDWAWKKGQRYGTIMVDLETQQVIDLLESRETQAVAEWLKTYPTIEIVTRDRASGYREAILQGAPQALQIADRWHLLQNLLNHVRHVLYVYRKKLKIGAPTALPVVQPAQSLATEPVVEFAQPEEPNLQEKSVIMVTTEPIPLTTSAEQHRQQSHEAVIALREQGLTVPEIVQETGMPRSTVYRIIAKGGYRPKQKRRLRSEQAQAIEQRQQAVRERHDQGLSTQTIATQLGISIRTVARDLATHPQRQDRRRKSSSVKPVKRTNWKRILQHLWDTGIRDEAVLLQQLREKGYPLSYHTLHDAVQKLHADIPLIQTKTGQTTRLKTYHPSQAAWLWVCDPAKLKPKQHRDLVQLLYAFPEALSLYTLSQGFRCMVTQAKADFLDYWLDLAERSPFAAFQSLARGMRRDDAAIRAALSYTWSNGQVEGQVNRLKAVRRQMYGRGRLSLLKRRLILSRHKT